MRIQRVILSTILLLIASLFLSTTAKAANEVFFISPGGGLTEFTGSNGSWSPITYFAGVGFVNPQNATVTAFAGGGSLYVSFFQNSQLYVMSSTDNVNWSIANVSVQT